LKEVRKVDFRARSRDAGEVVPVPGREDDDEQ
jgi:hypothetical protein